VKAGAKVAETLSERRVSEAKESAAERVAEVKESAKERVAEVKEQTSARVAEAKEESAARIADLKEGAKDRNEMCAGLMKSMVDEKAAMREHNTTCLTLMANAILQSQHVARGAPYSAVQQHHLLQPGAVVVEQAYRSTTSPARLPGPGPVQAQRVLPPPPQLHNQMSVPNTGLQVDGAAPVQHNPFPNEQPALNTLVRQTQGPATVASQPAGADSQAGPASGADSGGEQLLTEAHALANGVKAKDRNARLRYATLLAKGNKMTATEEFFVMLVKEALSEDGVQ
jgi:hypothetical protein